MKKSRKTEIGLATSESAKRSCIEMIMWTRIDMGLSVNAASKGSGLTQPHWHRIEKGERDATWEALSLMAARVGLTVGITIEVKK